MRHGLKASLLLLALIGSYRISDIVLGVISNVFYQDMAFTKDEIAWAVKTFGVIMAVFGGFLGGLLSMRYGVMKMLLTGALLSAITNLLFIAWSQLAMICRCCTWLLQPITFQLGWPVPLFRAFLSSLTNISFTAIQFFLYAALLMTCACLILLGVSADSICDQLCGKFKQFS